MSVQSYKAPKGDDGFPERSSPLPSEKEPIPVAIDEDPDAEFGGYESRRKLERKLLWKLDSRMSILVVIYILNYVGTLSYS